jgi:hypothetical protein
MKITEETDIEFKNYDDVSYKDTGEDDVMLFINGVPQGTIEVWTDRGNSGREYIIINYEMIYLDTITKIN